MSEHHTEWIIDDETGAPVQEPCGDCYSVGTRLRHCRYHEGWDTGQDAVKDEIAPTRMALTDCNEEHARLTAANHRLVEQAKNIDKAWFGWARAKTQAWDLREQRCQRLLEASREVWAVNLGRLTGMDAAKAWDRLAEFVGKEP